MKTRTSSTNQTVINATLTEKEVEALLADAILRTEGRAAPDHAVHVSVDRVDENSGTVNPVRIAYQVTITIDNDKLDKAAP